MEPENCFICEENLHGEGVLVGKKGISALLQASQKRDDNKSLFLVGKNSVKVYILCRKNYTRPDSIKADLKRQSEIPCTSSFNSKRLRSSAPQFNFKSKCFFCAEEIDETFREREKKKPLRKRRVVYKMSSLGIKEKVIGAADKRSDYWAEQVKCRLSIVTDLVAADGIYHFDCYMKFFLHISPRNGRKRGPPTREYTTAAMEDITSFLESNDECQHTMTELMSAVRG